jgi:arsenical pump membrane protein
VGELSWGLLPFVVGLFVAVQGLENLGIVGVASAWLSRMRPGSPEEPFAAAGATAFASNIMNNLPAALIARSVLLRSHAHMDTVLAALVGTDVGPMVTPFGSLATMLVLGLARREREEVRTGEFVMLGLWAAPVIVVATALALILT